MNLEREGDAIPNKQLRRNHFALEKKLVKVNAKRGTKYNHGVITAKIVFKMGVLSKYHYCYSVTHQSAFFLNV